MVAPLRSLPSRRKPCLFACTVSRNDFQMTAWPGISINAFSGETVSLAELAEDQRLHPPQLLCLSQPSTPVGVTCNLILWPMEFNWDLKKKNPFTMTLLASSLSSVLLFLSRKQDSGLSLALFAVFYYEKFKTYSKVERIL